MRAVATVFRRTLWIGCQIAFLWGACIGLTGCNCCSDFFSSLRGESTHDETADYCRKFRRVDSSIDAASFSNKARDIERDLGAP